METRKIIIGIMVVLFAAASFADAKARDIKGPRADTKGLLNSVKVKADHRATPKEKPRIVQSGDGYLQFVGAAPFTYFEAEGKKSAEPNEASGAFLQKNRNLFVNRSNNIGFDIKKVKTRDKRAFVRYKQTYAGLDVFGAEMIIQVNADGGIRSVSSDIMRNSELLDSGVVSVTPRITSSEAEEAAVNFLAEQHEGYEFEATPAKLMIYEPSVVGPEGPTQLIWQTEVGNKGKQLIRENILIDAQTEEVALHYSLIYDDCNRTVCNDNETVCRHEGDPPTGIEEIDKCYNYLGFVCEFYAVEHDRNSIDNNGMQVKAYVGTNWCNAAWFPSAEFMIFGNDFICDDVVGHEYTHGVTQHESDLIYYGQSGAINESFSDMWGEWIDQTYSDGNDNDTPEAKWKEGEDVNGCMTGPIRNMKNPPEFLDPDKMSSPYYYYGGSDNGGVHTNSGVGNKLCYLLTDGDVFNNYSIFGMGISKTADLMYDCQTNGLVSDANYKNLGEVLVQAAADFYENNEISFAEYQNVIRACSAVEIYGEFPVVFDEDNYNCNANVGISLADADLIGATTQDVNVITSGGDSNTVTLTVTEANGFVFTGSINTQPGEPNIGNGTLEVSHGETITVTYHDMKDSFGNEVNVTDTAGIDCVPPVVSDVAYEDIILLPGTQTITFETDEDASVKVRYGTVCGGPNTIEVSDSNFLQQHSITLTSFSPRTRYYFEIEATDRWGNTATNDNDGNCFSFYTYPREVNVPGDFNTIQAAIDDVFDGCIITVSTGTYYENINFRGKAITVRSTNPNNWGTVGSTIIDGIGRNPSPYTVQFPGGEGSDTVLTGFTVRHGYSGISCYFSYPTISNCIIEDNDNCGIDSSSAPHSPPGVIVTNCKIRNNPYGIMADSACTFTGNEIYSNTMGIYSVHITGTIRDNHIYSNTRGIYVRYNTTAPIEGNWIYGNSYGIYAEEYSTATIRDNEIYSNGDGIIGLRHTNLTADRNKIHNNGEGVYIYEYSTATIRNNFIYDNGYGIDVMFSPMTISNNTVVGNTECGISDWTGYATIYNCIIWDNQYDLDGEAAYSCISDCNYVGDPNVTHNFCNDPLFVNEANHDYHLGSNSPCINTGDPGRDYSWQADIDGDARVIDCYVDIGADEKVFLTPWPNHWWQLNECSGIITHDSIGNDDGTFNGNDPCWVLSPFGCAVDFNGVNDYFSVPTLDSVYNDGSNFTAAGWFKTTQTTGKQTIVGQWSQIYGYYSGWQVVVENSKVVAKFGGDVAPFTVITGTSDVNGGWHHFALVNNGTTSATLYVDGQPEGTAGTKYMDNYDTKFRIGGMYGTGVMLQGGPFHGTIDNVILYNKMLSAGEVEQLYQDELSGKASNPNPTNGATGVTIIPDLTWTADECAESYDVYFGDTNSPEFIGNQTGRTFDAGVLDYSTTYYWRIDVKNAIGTTTGDVWSFTTWAGPNPNNWWKFNECNGVTAYDSVNNDDGTFNGNDPCWVPGSSGCAVDFNGVNDYFSVSSLDSAYNQNSIFTVAGWFRTSQSTGIQTIVGQWLQDYAAGQEYYGWQVLVEGGKVIARFGNEIPTYDVTGTSTVNNNLWHHFVMVRNGINSVVLYVDGEPEGTAGEKDFLPYGKFRIGDGSACDGYPPTLKGGPFNGLIDDVMLFNRMLSANEIRQLYLEGMSQKASNPNPANGATGVGINPDLTWADGIQAETYDVYFGETNPPAFVGNQTGTTFEPNTLNYSTTYYWRIDVKNAAGTITGDVWNFTTWAADPNTWWKFDECSGIIAYDSVDSHDATFNGDDPCWVPGPSGCAVDFNGVNDYFSVSSLDSAYNQNSIFTVAGWFRTSQSTGIQTIVGQWSQAWEAGQEYYGWQVLVENNKVVARFGHDVDIYDITGNKTVTDYVWHHFAMVRNGTSVAVYVDGEPKGSGTANFEVYNTKFRIGDGSYTFSYPPSLKGGPFNGMIDSVMLFNRVLSAEEIEQLYEEGL